MTNVKSPSNSNLKTLVLNISEVIGYEQYVRNSISPAVQGNDSSNPLGECSKYMNFPVEVYFKIQNQEKLNFKAIKTYLDEKELSSKAKEDNIIIQFHNAPISVVIQKDSNNSDTYLATFYTMTFKEYIIPGLLNGLEQIVGDNEIILLETKNPLMSIISLQ
jgi:hypothetical protein